MRHRRYRRKRAMLNDLPLTPLIDTALTLLIIFMITSPIMHNAIKVDLPQGKAKEDGQLQEQFVVYIDKQEQLYLNEKNVTKDELFAQLVPEKLQAAQGTVYVKADQGVSYGCVIELVDTLKVAGGVRYVALATKKQA